jgi:hypothetical protein
LIFVIVEHTAQLLEVAVDFQNIKAVPSRAVESELEEILVESELVKMY